MIALRNLLLAVDFSDSCLKATEYAVDLANQFGATLGGPIKKNKAFFFFDYDGQRNTTPNTVILTVPPIAIDPLSLSGYNELASKSLTPYGNGLRNNVYLAKVDYALFTGQQLSFRYNANRFNGVNFENTGANSAQEHTGNSDVITDNAAVNYTNVIGPSTLFESRFSWIRDNEPGAANSSAPEAQIRQAGTLVMQVGRNNFSPRYTNAKTYQFVESLSHHPVTSADPFSSTAMRTLPLGLPRHLRRGSPELEQMGHSHTRTRTKSLFTYRTPGAPPIA